MTEAANRQRAIGSARAKFGVVAATALLTAACATPGPAIVPPEVRLEHVELDKLGLYGQTFLLEFAVSNPNPFPLPVNSVRYEIRLDGRHFAGGGTRGGFTVGSGASGHFTISVETDLLQSVSGFNTLLEGGADRPVRYQLDGSLGMDIPGVPPVPFSQSGSVGLATH